MSQDLERLTLLLEARTKEFENALTRAQKETNRKLKGIEDRAKAMSRNVQTAMAGALASFGAVQIGKEGLIIAGDYEAAMGRVKEAALASAHEMRQLNAAARDLGRSPLGVTAREAAEGFEILARNGVSVRDVLGGAAQASLVMSRAMGVDLARGADLITDVMAQFKAQAGDLPMLADRIAGAVNNSKFGFEDYRQAIANAGGVAATAGMDFEELLAAIAGTSAQFASGADAGTSLKTFIMSLSPTSRDAREEIERLGMSFYTASGQLKPLTEIAEELRNAMAGLSEQARVQSLKTIFGDDAIRSAAALAEQGAAGITRLSEAIGKISAQSQAEARMKGLNGALLAVKAAWEDLLLTAANQGGLEAATAAVESLTSALKYLAENFEYIYPWVERLATALAAVLVARGLNYAVSKAIALGGAVLTMARNIGAASGIVSGLGLALRALGGPLGFVVALAGITFAGFVRGARSAAERLESVEKAAFEAGAAYEKLHEVENQLKKDREDLKRASEAYAAAVRDEGVAAQETAMQEVAAIRKRIEGREALRMALLDEANAKAHLARAERDALRDSMDTTGREMIDAERAPLLSQMRTMQASRSGSAEERAALQAQIAAFDAALGGDDEAAIARMQEQIFQRAREARVAGMESPTQTALLDANLALQKAEEAVSRMEALQETLSKPAALPAPAVVTPPQGLALPPGGGSARSGETPEQALAKLRAELASITREMAALDDVTRLALDSSGQAGLDRLNAVIYSTEARLRIAKAMEDARIPEGSTPTQTEEIRQAAGKLEEARIRTEALRDGLKDRTREIGEEIEAERKANEERAAASDALSTYATKLEEARSASARLLAAAQESDEAHAESVRTLDEARSRAAALTEAEETLAKAKKAGVEVSEEQAAATRAAALAVVEGEAAVRRALEERRKATEAAEAAKRREEGVTMLAAYAAEVEGRLAGTARLVAAARETQEAYDAEAQAQADAASAAEALTSAEEALTAAKEAGVLVSDAQAASLRASALAAVEGAQAVRRALEERQKAEKAAEEAKRRTEAAASLAQTIARTEREIERQKALEEAAGESVSAYQERSAAQELQRKSDEALAQAEAALAEAEKAGAAASTEAAARFRAAAQERVQAEDRTRRAIEARQKQEALDLAAREALENARRSVAQAQAQAADVGLPAELVRAREAARIAEERLRNLKIPEGATADGRDAAALQAEMQAEELRRLNAEADKARREKALEMLEAQRSAEQRLTDQIRETLALQGPLAHLIRDRALAQGDAAAAAQAEAEAQRIVSAEVHQLELAKKGLKDLVTATKEGFASAFESAVFGAKSARQAVGDLILEISKLTFQKSVAQPLSNAFSGLFGNLLGSSGLNLAAAKGAAFLNGHVQAFAKGGIVDSPTLFSHAGGMGLMGEAGTEAILPLKTGPGGRLGVDASGVGGGGSSNYYATFNISTPDVQGFYRTQNQIAAAGARFFGKSSRST